MPHTRQKTAAQKEAQSKYFKKWYSKQGNKAKQKGFSKIAHERRKVKQEQQKVTAAKLHRTVKKLKESPSEQVMS